MSFTYDPAKPPGSRIVEAEIGDQPVEASRVYKVATNDYVYGGGDGYEALSRGKALIDPSGGTLLASMVMDYIEQEGEVAPATEGRITRVD
jgi:5'-nucleotidase / UDP-sugar diphosphatase